MGGKMKTKIFYTCGIGWQHDPDIKLFESADLLKARTSCWTESEECGGPGEKRAGTWIRTLCINCKES
jgi:hypothetical protein